MNKKYIVIGAVVLAIVCLIIGAMVGGNESQPLGAANRLPHGYWDTADGYYVDGTAVINGSGVVTGTVSGTVTGTLTGPQKEPQVTPTASTTLTVAQSGSTFNLGTAGVNLTLPAVASSAGVRYKFVISAAYATDNITVTSAAGDDIEGSLIVAGAVVDCDANDVITSVADGENLGDFFEIFSNGTKWFIGQSGALTASKLTCSG
jgi:hypothetical protein